MSTAKVPGTESRAGKLDQVVSKLANRDSAALVTAEEAQKAHHRRRKAQVPCRIIKTTEIRSREGTVHPVDSDTDEEEDDRISTAADSCKSGVQNPANQASGLKNGIGEDGTDKQVPDILPEGTLVLEPEAVNDNGPYVGPEFGTTKSRPRSGVAPAGGDLMEKVYKCTVCNQQLYPLNSTTVKEHPKLSVLMCQSCHKFYESGDFDRDKNGYEEQCRWCGQGGHLVCCDSCEKAFCKSCIRRNLGREHLFHVMNAGEWHCLCCDRKPLAFLIRECGQLLSSLSSNQGAAAACVGVNDAQHRRPAKRNSLDTGKSSTGPKASASISADVKKPSSVVSNNKKATVPVGGNQRKAESSGSTGKAPAGPKPAVCGDADVKTANLGNSVDVKTVSAGSTSATNEDVSPAAAGRGATNRVAGAESSAITPATRRQASSTGDGGVATPESGSSRPSRSASVRALLPKPLAAAAVVAPFSASSFPAATGPASSTAADGNQRQQLSASAASTAIGSSSAVTPVGQRQLSAAAGGRVATPESGSRPSRSASGRALLPKPFAAAAVATPGSSSSSPSASGPSCSTTADGHEHQSSVSAVTTTTAASVTASSVRRGATPSVLQAKPQSADSSLIVLPLGIVPRAAIRGSRTTFPELVHRLSDQMVEKIKRKLAGVHPSSDVKLLVEELLPKEVNAPTSVRRRRLYEVPWAMLGFQAPSTDRMLGAPAAGGTPVPAAVVPGGTNVGGGKTGTAQSATAVKLRVLPSTVAMRPPASIQMAPRSASFGQQPTSGDISLAEIINNLKRRELFDPESTTNRCLHMFEQAKMNFTELRKDVHAIKQAKMRHDQEATSRRQGLPPPHVEREASLHERIKAALIDHLREVHQICTQSLRATGIELARTAPARALPQTARQPCATEPAVAVDSQNDEYIDLTEFEQLHQDQRGNTSRTAAREPPSVQTAPSGKSATAAGSRGTTTQAGDAAYRQTGKKLSAAPAASESETGSAARTPSQHSADDTDGNKSEASEDSAARSTRLRQSQRRTATSSKPSDRSEQASGDDDAKEQAVFARNKGKVPRSAEEGSENDLARLSILGEFRCSSSDDDGGNDGDDDNDEDTGTTHSTRAKQRLTPAKRNLSAISRDLRIAGQRHSATAGDAGTSVGKQPEAARVLLNRLSDRDIARLREKLKLETTERQKQSRDSEPSESLSVVDREERALSRLLRVKSEIGGDGKAPQHPQCDDSMSSVCDGAEACTDGTKAAGPSSGSDREPRKKRVKMTDKERSKCKRDPSSDDSSSSETGSDSLASADDTSAARSAATVVPSDAVADDDSNKAALRSLLNEGLFNSSLDDTSGSDSDEVTRPKAVKRRRIGSPTDVDKGDSLAEVRGSPSDGGSCGGDSCDDVPDESGAASSRDKSTHPLLRQRLSLGADGSGSKSSASPATAGKPGSDCESAEADGSDGSSTKLPPNLSDKPKMKHSHQSEESSTDDSSRTSMDSDRDSEGGGGGGAGSNAAAARGAKKRSRHISSSSSSSNAHVRSYNVRKRRRRVNALESSDSSQSSDESYINNALSGAENDDAPKESSLADSSQRRRRIRRLIEADRLREETKAAAKAEEERRQRILEKQQLYNQYVLEHSDTGAAPCPALTELVLDRDGEGNSIVSVNRELLVKLKPHQAEAVQFLWDCVIESVARVKSKNVAAAAGSGAILAHCMGLGKTLSVITFIHTVLSHKSLLSMHTVVVVSPLSTISNWASEWEKWQENVDNRVQVFDMSMMRKNADRAQMLLNWRRDGGVLLLGYDMYRTLVVGKRIKDKSMKETFTTSLVDPGPDIIVCDEGHLLKNEATGINKSLVQARTMRRIVLTGTPLQNNLQEYFVMTDFVKPNLLGSKKEFSNRFIQPIQNGQCKDSTPADVKLMKKRAHVLHEMLAGCVQRRDYSALMKYLPPKLEYIVSVRLSKLQILLYERYLQLRGNRNSGTTAAFGLFADYQTLLKIWTHPWLLHLEKFRREAPDDDFLNDETTSEGSVDDDDDDILVQNSSDDGDATWKPLKKKKTDKKESELLKDLDVIDVDADVPVRPEVTGLDPNWWLPLVPSSVEKQFDQSGKLLLLFEILRLSEEIGDKVLVFSQSLLTLDYIEDALSVIDAAVERPNGDPQLKTIAGTGRFVRGTNYFRFDGSVSVHHRTRMCEKFNDPSNFDARLFLISTRAGGLGINLYAANRIVMLDASWNPSQDVQAIFRAYRFGQVKPCYVYRLVSQGTMEERIYERQVTKLSLSERVVDEKQIERHFLASDLQELYKFTPDRPDDDNPLPRETPVLPKDRVLAELLEGKTRWIVSYHEHDSLLENLVSEQLTEEERKTAWDEYKAEKERGSATAAEIAAAAAVAAAASGAGASSSISTGSGGARSSQPLRQSDAKEILRFFRGRLQQEQPSLPEDELNRRTIQLLQTIAGRSPAEATLATTLLHSFHQQKLALLPQQNQMPLAGMRLPQHSEVGNFRIAAPIPYIQTAAGTSGFGLRLATAPTVDVAPLSQPQHVRPGGTPNVGASWPSSQLGFAGNPASHASLMAAGTGPDATAAAGSSGAMAAALSAAAVPRLLPVENLRRFQQLQQQQQSSASRGSQPNVAAPIRPTRPAMQRSLPPGQQSPQLGVATQPTAPAGVPPNSPVAITSPAASGVGTVTGGSGTSSSSSISSGRPL